MKRYLLAFGMAAVASAVAVAYAQTEPSQDEGAAAGAACPGCEQGGPHHPGPQHRGPQRGGPEGQVYFEGQPPQGPPPPEELFKEIDSDGDGMISLEEFVAHGPPLPRRRERVATNKVADRAPARDLPRRPATVRCVTKARRPVTDRCANKALRHAADRCANKARRHAADRCVNKARRHAAVRWTNKAPRHAADRWTTKGRRHAADRWTSKALRPAAVSMATAPRRQIGARRQRPRAMSRSPTRKPDRPLVLADRDHTPGLGPLGCGRTVALEG
ncbi:hypothetical protein Pla175_13620 [Pirellulimonas nuda]|uniref:EF-hand domain-containing protein n=1 Tax=Pirellulimonas nuda TaxID=2528009 RepID=A0A518D938_9BACT|nr:EF-hand domain-containing protein [Pirellulimonas nuda]QDU87993.1 hypothetical protein Pla175_13620 [Pirellulimonas nuda]